MDKDGLCLMMELITIIIPIYKVENHLSKCIESIINQTYKNLEIILVNDNSPDTCPDICDKFASQDKRIKVIHKSNNSGVSAARNLGLDRATGEYISFVDGDDWIELNMIEVMYSLIKEDNSDIAMCGYSLVYPNKYVESDQRNIRKKMNNIEALKEILVGSVKGFLVNKLFKRNIFNDIEVPEDMDIFEDLYTCCNILTSKRKIVYVSSSLYNYVQNADSVTNDLSKYFHENGTLKAITVLNSIKKIYKNEKKILNYIEIATANSVEFIYIQILIMEYGNQLNEKHYKYIRRELKSYYKSYLVSNELSIKNKIKYSLLVFTPFIMKSWIKKRQKANY